jgi:PAS domain S-box-containing protein
MSSEDVADRSGWPALFWEAFRQSKNGMVLLDDARRHVEVNGAYLQLVGHRREDLIGRPVYDLVAGGPLLNQRQWRATLNQKQFTGVADLISAGGGQVRVEFAGHPEVVTGRQLVLVVVLRAAPATRGLRSQAAPRAGPVSLSPRELEIVGLIAMGLSGPEIAEELQVTHNTVRTHTRNTMTKLGARSRAQLVAKCLGEGLLWGEIHRT